MALVTKEKVKEYLDITHTDWDVLINNLVSRMSGFVETYCSRKFEVQSYQDEKYDGLLGNRGQLFLRNYPVTSIASLFDDTENQYGLDTEIAADDFLLYGNEGIIQLKDSEEFDVGFQNIKATYTAGYASVPLDLQQACIELVALKLNSRKKENIKSESLGRWSTSYGEIFVTDGIKEILDRYSAKSMVMI